MARLDRRIGRLFEGELEQARRDLNRVLRAMTKLDKQLMMDGFQAEFSGEPYPAGFDEVMAHFERLGGIAAQRRLELLETDADRAEAVERRRRMAAGENWREINL